MQATLLRLEWAGAIWGQEEGSVCSTPEVIFVLLGTAFITTLLASVHPVDREALI